MLSVCILANNDEEKLKATLQSVQGDEVIIVDRSGKDKLKKTAEEHHAAFHVYDYSDDLPGAMSEAIRYATGDWVLFLHAGEVLDTKAAETLRELNKADAYTFSVKGEKYVRLFKNFAAIHFEEGNPPKVEPILARIQAEIEDSGISL